MKFAESGQGNSRQWGAMKFHQLENLTGDLHSFGSIEYLHAGLYEAKCKSSRKPCVTASKMLQSVMRKNDKTKRLFCIPEAQKKKNNIGKEKQKNALNLRSAKQGRSHN